MTHTIHTHTHIYVHMASAPQVTEWWPNCLSIQLTLKAIEKSEGRAVGGEVGERREINCLVHWASVKWTHWDMQKYGGLNDTH